MNASVARVFAVTVIVVSLLATGTVLSLRGAGDVALAAVFTCLGTAIPLVLRWLTSTSGDPPTDKGGTGSAAVLMVVGSVLATHASGCTPSALPEPCTADDYRETARACMRQYSAEADRVACRKANAARCNVTYTPGAGQ